MACSLPADVCVRLRMKEYYTATPLTATVSLSVLYYRSLCPSVGLPYIPSMTESN